MQSILTLPPLAYAARVRIASTNKRWGKREYHIYPTSQHQRRQGRWTVLPVSSYASHDIQVTKSNIILPDLTVIEKGRCNRNTGPVTPCLGFSHAMGHSSALVQVFVSVRHRGSMAAVGHRQCLNWFCQKVLTESEGRDGKGKGKLNTKWNSTEPKRRKGSGSDIWKWKDGRAREWDSRERGKEKASHGVRHQVLCTATCDTSKNLYPIPPCHAYLRSRGKFHRVS